MPDHLGADLDQLFAQRGSPQKGSVIVSLGSRGALWRTARNPRRRTRRPSSRDWPCRLADRSTRASTARRNRTSPQQQARPDLSRLTNLEGLQSSCRKRVVQEMDQGADAAESDPLDRYTLCRYSPCIRGNQVQMFVNQKMKIQSQHDEPNMTRRLRMTYPVTRRTKRPA